MTWDGTKGGNSREQEEDETWGVKVFFGVNFFWKREEDELEVLVIEHHKFLF